MLYLRYPRPVFSSSFMTGKPLILSDGRVVNARGVVTGGIPPYRETQRYVRFVLTLLNNGVNGRIERSNLRFRLDARRDFTLDAFDLSELAQKLFRTRPSSFVEVQ